MKALVTYGVLAAALLCMPATAGDAELHTQGFINGRMWRSIPDDMRIGYLNGVYDGIRVIALCKDLGQPWEDTLQIYQPFTTSSQLSNELLKLYSDDANVNIPVPVMFLPAYMDVHGESKVRLNSMLRKMRQGSGQAGPN